MEVHDCLIPSIDVAMKTSQFDEASLINEAELLARVRGHDHVIHLQGIMIKEDRFHLIMSLCTNQSLREFLDRNKEAMRGEENDLRKLQWARQVTEMSEKVKLIYNNIA